ncbi:hypothetical protein M378DRAFT_7570 [Amanita muscaria Koide BX008]|uniref:C3H1-type domain-containing protein n=1 Tax=Amanita muscaria (strain Koide BX008) TaxID=946122 RepID=A0A0C2XKZ3_AMAMK|nr:hypothetical protein M378DRAFT_7570 [Amanita muscaria Koide BX008]
MAYQKRSKRCHFFDEYGGPVGTGCSKGVENCPFVHPTEPLWDRLRPVAPVYPRRRTGHPRSPDRLRRSPTPLADRISPRRASTSDRSTTFSSRYRSPSPIPRSPISPKASRPGPSFAAPASKPVPTKDNKESNELRVRADSIASSVPSHSHKGEPPIPKQSTAHIHQLQDQNSTNTRRLTSTMSASSNLQQSTASFPPLPAPPALLSVKKLLPRAELTTEQKRQVWTEYIQLLADNIQQGSEAKKLEGDISLLERILSLSSEESVAGARKATVGTKLAALNAQLKELENKKQGTFSRITAAENWPVPPIGDNQDKEALSKVAAYHEELSQCVEKINSLLARSASVIPSDASVGDAGRPPKRRRTDDGGKEERQEPPARASPDVSEEMRDRVLKFHESMTTIQNYQTTLRNDLTAEYKEYIDAKMEDAVKDAATSVEAAEEKFKVLESNIKLSDNDLEELAVDIEKLMLDNQAFGTQIAETNQTITDTIASITQLQQRQLELTNRRDQQGKAIEALQAAVAAHTARPTSPPISPVLPPIDYIVQAVHDPLLDAARSAIKPLLTSTKEDIEGLLKERHAEMYQTLWSRLGLTLKVVDALSARIGPSGSSSSVDASTS